MAGRFLTLEEVAEELAVTRTQIYTMARKGEIPAIKIGQKGHWRVERSRLEEWIAEQYRATAEYVRKNPFPDSAEA
ncbi:MAG TPA: helix-turn-helix domain-containing protein [Micromonosporaceae bacterium]|jgi:excisionase family DNA binding protein